MSTYFSNDEKSVFVRNNLFYLTFAGVSQRGNLYIKIASESRKLQFKSALQEKMEAIAKEYVGIEVQDEKHTKNIEVLAGQMSAAFGDILVANTVEPHKGTPRFRIGSAQKALNLYLKYLWVFGYFPANTMPPHCPFDRIVLEKINKILGSTGEVDCWTQMDSIKQYGEWVRLAHAAAKGIGLSLWELQAYNSSVKAAKG